MQVMIMLCELLWFPFAVCLWNEHESDQVWVQGGKKAADTLKKKPEIDALYTLSV